MELLPSITTEHQQSLRPLSVEWSTLDGTDGSCTWRSGGTQVLAAVHGPVSPQLPQHEQAQGATVSVSVHQAMAESRSTPGESGMDREYESFLKHIVTACVVATDYPRCTIAVIVHVLAADGSVLAAMIHAAMGALMDARISLRTIPVATTLLVDMTTIEYTTSTKPSGQTASIRLDPSGGEEKKSTGGVVVLVADGQKPLHIIGCHTSGKIRLDTELLLSCTRIQEKATPAVVAFYRLANEQKIHV
jgi:ribonuclease PH